MPSSQIWRIHCVLLIMAAVPTTFLSRSANAEPVMQRPNILFIMTDQQHAGMISCTGNGISEDAGDGQLGA